MKNKTTPIFVHNCDWKLGDNTTTAGEEPSDFFSDFLLFIKRAPYKNGKINTLKGCQDKTKGFFSSVKLYFKKAQDF